MSIKNLRERRAQIAAELKALLDDSKKAGNWPVTSQEKYDAHMAEVADIDATIDRTQRILDLEAAERIPTLGAQDRKDLSNPKNLEPKAIFNAWLRGGDSALSAEQHAAIRNTMSTTTNSEGGYTVQTDVAKSVLEALKAFGGMRAAATVIQTAKGNPLQFPTSDGTSEVGEIMPQNTAGTRQDVSFGVKTLGMFKYGSKDVAIPIELLQDSEVDVEGLVRARLVERLGRITNQHFTVGAGTTVPWGIVTRATGSAAATGSQTVFTYDQLIDLIHAIDPAYRATGCSWMMHDTLLRNLRKVKDGQQRPIFFPGYYERGITGAPGEDMLLGYPVRVNQDMPVPGANAKSLLFGQMGKYVIRDCMDIVMYRFTDSAYAKLGQVGFLAMMRSDGDLLDVGGAVKYLANSAT
jgi:HK97 family phage major capsid protein